MSVKLNVVANVAGKVWSGLMSFAFVPFYIGFMGIEAYGLIGFFASLVAVFFVLDMGLSTAINRELAKLGTREESAKEGRDLVRTLEFVYWATGIAVGVVIVFLAPWLARDWLNTEGLTIYETTQTIRLMGLVATLRWPVPLYAGALMGLQRQVLLNATTSLMATLQGGGAVLVLWLVSPTIQAFFLWQVIASAVQIILLPSLLWRILAQGHHRPRFSMAALRSVILFSAGVTGITALSVILTQADKFMLSKLVTLEMFGYYSFAASIAAVLNLAAMAVYGALFPAFSQLIEGNRTQELIALYHKSCQLLSVLLLPVGITVILFARELLAIYVSNDLVVEHTHALLRLLVVGNMMLSVMLLPLALQLAYGWTALSLYKNIVAVICFVPLLWLMVSHYGATGAAIVWILLTVGYFLIEVPLMHRRILKHEHWRWYFLDIGVPAAVSLGILGVARLLIPRDAPLTVSIPAIAVAALAALSATILAMPSTRSWSTALLLRGVGR